MLPLPSVSSDIIVEMNIVKSCPGEYCGRETIDADCGACPRGFQPNGKSPWSQCTECDGSLALHDWLYLGFMALLSLVLHWFFIDFKTRGKRFRNMDTSNMCLAVLVLHLSALMESAIAAVLTLLMADPLGSMHIRSCNVNKLSDWYTMLYNPSPNYTFTLHCTQELVYPLYTMVMVYYAISLVLLMVIRPVISYKLVEGRGTKSIYAALYFLPILIVLQAVFGGLLYYAFPFIVLVVSVVTSAVHLASMKEQKMRDLIVDSFTNGRNATILIGHWLLHAYGIISLTLLKQPGFQAPLIALVPFPAIFYVLTVRFSNPDNLGRT